MAHSSLLSEAREALWHYLDKDGTQHGPFSVQQIAVMFDDGVIDGMTLVWHAAMGSEWKAISEVEALREIIRTLTQPEEHAPSPVEDDRQVFPQDEMSSLYSAGGKDAKQKPDQKKSFVGDDGVRPVAGGQSAGLSAYETDEEENGNALDEELSSAVETKAAHQAEPSSKGVLEKKRKKKRKRTAQFDKESSKWVYVTGLPQDITPEELELHFKQVGVLAVDPESQQPRLKIYKDDQGIPKGDASVAYFRPESVDLAIEVLNEGFIRPAFPLKVSKAVFQVKGDAMHKNQKTAEAKLKIVKQAAKMALSWNDEDDSGVSKSKALRIVVIKNLFHPKEAQAAGFVEELKEDLDSECSQLGPMEKMTIFEKNPEGVVIIKFGTSYAAEQCVKLMNGRFFAGRKLVSFYWDGATDFTKAIYSEPRQAEFSRQVDHEGEAGARQMEGQTIDADKDEEHRHDTFGDWLDNQELPDEFNLEVGA